MTSPVDAALAWLDGYERHAYGPGPDSVGSTFNSWHYYNPRTGKGNAPRAAGLFFEQLAKRQEAAKSAAWSAHFLADMAVPYHVNGLFAAELTPAYQARLIADDPINLDEQVTGPRRILSLVNFGTVRRLVGTLNIHDADFVTEAQRFYRAEGGVGVHDWFDPWYWNGPDCGADSGFQSPGLGSPGSQLPGREPVPGPALQRPLARQPQADVRRSDRSDRAHARDGRGVHRRQRKGHLR